MVGVSLKPYSLQPISPSTVNCEDFQRTDHLVSRVFVFVCVSGWAVIYRPCMIFNNATSLPLLLLQSLGKTGTLKSLVGEGEEMDDVISRGRVSALDLMAEQGGRVCGMCGMWGRGDEGREGCRV